MKVWITKYALSKGIRELEAEGFKQGAAVINNDGVYDYFYGDDWHSTRERAVKRAEAMRLKEISKLKGRLTKLERMTFK